MASPKKAKKDSVAFVEVPEWVKNENDKYFGAFMSFLMAWHMFGAPTDALAKDYFSLDSEGWDDSDTEYVFNKFVEHGFVNPKGSVDYWYVLADTLIPCVVMRSDGKGLYQRFDYNVNSWVADYEAWYSRVINSNEYDEITKDEARSIIERYGGEFYE